MFLAGYGFHGRGSQVIHRLSYAGMAFAAAIAFQNAIQHPIAFSVRFEQYGAGAIAKNNTSGAITIVYNGTHFICSDNYYFFITATFDQCSAGSQAYKETRAGCARSNPQAFSAPTLSQTMLAVDGKNISGVTVPTIRQSISSGSMPLFLHSSNTAGTPRSELLCLRLSVSFFH